MAKALTGYLFSVRSYTTWPDLGLLIGRVAACGMMAMHGWQKLTGFGEMSKGFPDPIGLHYIGLGGKTALGLAIFAEFFCALLLAAGLMSRLATIPLITTMAVAAIIVHRADPFQVKELAFLYLTVFVTLLLTGPGRFSLDHVIGNSRAATRPRSDSR